MARFLGLSVGLVLALIASAQAERLVFAAFRNLVTTRYREMARQNTASADRIHLLSNRMDPIVSPGLISQQYVWHTITQATRAYSDNANIYMTFLVALITYLEARTSRQHTTLMVYASRNVIASL